MKVLESDLHKDQLLELTIMKMPFGRYKNTVLCDLPVSYLEWFAREGFPNGKLGKLLQTLHVIKTNGLNEILVELKRIKTPPLNLK